MIATKYALIYIIYLIARSIRVFRFHVNYSARKIGRTLRKCMDIKKKNRNKIIPMESDVIT